MNSDDRQLSIPNCPPPDPADHRHARKRRAVHLQAQIRGEQRPVQVTIDCDLVTFRAKGRHVLYSLPLTTWIGMGYQRAAEVAAADAKNDRRRARSIRRLAATGTAVALAVAGCTHGYLELNPDATDAGDDVVDVDDVQDLAETIVDDAGDGDAGVDVPCGAWWFEDLDGDRFGTGTPIWIDCGTPPPSGWVDVGGDCCDQVADVHPLQVEWFERPSGCGGRPRFDFDCDGLETARWDFADCGDPPGCDIVAEGFALPAVACGMGAMLTISCSPGSGGCVSASTRAATQSCR